MRVVTPKALLRWDDVDLLKVPINPGRRASTGCDDLTPGYHKAQNFLGYAPEVHRASSHCTMVARGTIMLMTPETVARIAAGLDHNPAATGDARKSFELLPPVLA